MTTPVEAQIAPGRMYFWVAEDQKDKAESGNDKVTIIDVPKRNVASIGARGAYNQSNYDEAKSKLLNWIASNDSITPEGDPYAVYWNGPFTPWSFRTFEVQIQVKVD